MKRTIQEQISANKSASMVYASMLVLLLTALGAAITGFYDMEYWYVGAAGAFLLGLILAALALGSGDSIILSLSGARPATHAEHQVLDNVAEEMSIAAGIPKPKVYIIDDSAPNAFATGKDPKSGVVVFTSGLISKLNRDELQGVMAHEISHIRNYDIRFMTTIALVAGLIPLLADFLLRLSWFGGGRSRRSDNNTAQGIFMIAAIVLAILAPLFSILLQMAVSRKRELLADASAAELTRYPEGLASALRKIAADPEPLEAANRATQHLYIVNPLKNFTERSSALFSTHPPIEERIRALNGLMGMYPSRQRRPDDFSDMPDIPNMRNRH